MTKTIEIVLTGGPSSGKSTSMSYIFDKLTEWGYNVFVVPEVATQVFAMGVPDPEYLSKHNRAGYHAVEKAIVQIQMDTRIHYRRLAMTFNDKPVVILYDRAEMDARAYLSKEEFAACLEERGVNSEEVRDSYDAVIHMRTVAFLEAARYDKDSNPQRREDREGALEADRATLQAWLGHPNLHIVDPQDFEAKKRDALGKVAYILGRDRAIVMGRERRFLVRPDYSKRLDEFLPEIVNQYKITQHYLKGSTVDEWSVLVKRETVGAKESTITYYRGDTTAHELEEGGKISRGRIISRDDYVRQLRIGIDKDREPLVKKRTTFTSNDCDIEVDEFESGLVIISMSAAYEDVDLPEWFGQEVTDNPGYSTVSLALNGTKDNE